MNSGEVQVTFEFSRQDGYLAVYARFRPGKVHTTYEISPGVASDIDREGRILGVEIVQTFSTKARKIRLRHIIDLDQIQKAIERRFGISLKTEFREIREAASALS